jgi:hypothetical protein
MLDSWILSKLEPLVGSPLIILRDPQRMIVSGARVVDGWAEEHGYTVLFCTGNLALREMYEAIREDTEAKILLVDRSRAGTLFYPDLETQADDGNVLSLSLRKFLIEQTGDTAWPKLVDDRQLSGILLEDLPAALRAYENLRQASPKRFSDSDLYKIALGAALKINPFKKLSPAEIRRLCIEQHQTLESLKGRLPEEVLTTLHHEIAKAPQPFCWLLERDPDLVMRSFTLAAILHQHKLDYRLLMANIDPLMHDYREINPDFLDQALKDQLQADPDKVLEDVHAVETALIKNPAGMALILRDQLCLDDPKRALEALKDERLSNLVRCLALASLLVDMIMNKDNKFHLSVLKELDKQENNASILVTRRPTDQWLDLTTTYSRAVNVYGLMDVLANVARKLKVTEANELDFAFFDNAWNRDHLNRLDFYLSDLERMLRVGDLLPVPLDVLWHGFAKRWKQARQAFQDTVAATDIVLNVLNNRFQDFYRLHYTRWLSPQKPGEAGSKSFSERSTEDNQVPVIFTHQFLPRLLKPYWDPQKKQKAVILVFDGLRTDAWDEFLRPVLEERYEIIHSQPGSAILPTETTLSRKALSAGKLPADFPPGSKRESELLKAWFNENFGWAPNFEIIRDSDTEASGMVVRYDSPQLEYIVFNFTDENLHHNQNELALIYRSVVREIVQQDVRSVLRDLPEDALIFVTSDHGFIPMPTKIVNVPSEVVVDDRDVKYRNARTLDKLPEPDAEKSVVFDVRVLGIPKTSPSVRDTAFNYLLFPRAGYIFKRPKGPHNPDKYSHGGLSLAECMVPMVVLAPRKESQHLLIIESLRQVGSASEGEMLELEITLQASQMLAPETPFSLSFNREDIPARREIFTGIRKTILVRWSPEITEMSDEVREAGEMVLPVSVLLTYREGEELVRTSRAADVHIKLDTTRLRRRLDSKLDLLMGKVPRELKG